MDNTNTLSVALILNRIAQRGEDGLDAAAALAELYDYSGAKAYSLVVMILGDSLAAEEVTQDVFLKIWHRPDAYRYDNGQFATWLLTVARHTAFDYLRREKRRCWCTASLDDEAFPELHDVCADEDQRWRELSSLMDVLPVAQRETLTLSYYRGMSHQDISAYLDVPLGTIKTRMKLGMDKLRMVWQRSSGVRIANMH